MKVGMTKDERLKAEHMWAYKDFWLGNQKCLKCSGLGYLYTEERNQIENQFHCRACDKTFESATLQNQLTAEMARIEREYDDAILSK